MKRIACPTVFTLLTLLLIPCGASAIEWFEVNTWLYQLQNYDLGQIRSSAFDLAVIDYSSDGTAWGEWTSAEIESIRYSPGGDKKVVAYMSIGEAEDYRFYWQPWWGVGNPDWIVKENPAWPGNYKVKYWDPEWQAIIFGSEESYLGKIIAQGFDGVYLDIVDAYAESYARQALGGIQASRQAMVDFVIAIAEWGRANSPHGMEFGIFPQNAEDLSETEPEYLAAVNGIGKEETYFMATSQPTSASDRYWTELNLAPFLSAGPWGFGLVLEVDYTDVQYFMDYVYWRCENYTGFIPYCSNVDLDATTINPGHEPENSAEIHGTVRLLGEPAENASVWMIRVYPYPLVRKMDHTDSEGAYSLRFLSSGLYWLIASKSGYYQIQGVYPGPGESVQIDFWAGKVGVGARFIEPIPSGWGVDSPQDAEAQRRKSTAIEFICHFERSEKSFLCFISKR